MGKKFFCSRELSRQDFPMFSENVGDVRKTRMVGDHQRDPVHLLFLHFLQDVFPLQILNFEKGRLDDIGAVLSAEEIPS